MTKEEILSLYKKAYKEAAEITSEYDSGDYSDSITPTADIDPATGLPVVYSPAQRDMMTRYKLPDPSVEEQEFNRALQRMSDPGNSPLDYQRRALAQVYGQNHLNSLDDNAYVQRRWNAAMRGSRARQLMAAYQKARQTGNGMTAGAGMFYGGQGNAARLNRPYAIGTPYQRPTLARPQPQWTPTTLPDRHYDRNNPTAVANQQWQANRQATKQQNQRYKSMGIIPDGVKKEFGI